MKKANYKDGGRNILNRSRDAVSTIKGYYFQFDHYILQLLQLQKDNESVRIEGIEDVDIIANDHIEAVQCKYYEGTSCTSSVVGEAIRPMLVHFAKHKDDSIYYYYSLFGHYRSGQDTIKTPLSVEYAKQKFFTYTKDRKKHELHNELGLSDFEIENFLHQLNLQLNATTYEVQIEKIIALLKKVISCSEYDARYFYYNNAISLVKRLSVKKSIVARTISKRQFLEEICKKKDLFDKWYIEYIGFKKFYAAARKHFFSKINISPAHRVFLIECDEKVSDTDLARMIVEISDKWSRLSKRESTPFCPYICIYRISAPRLVNIKDLLLENNFHIWDGYEYQGAIFSPLSLARQVNYYVGIKSKIINKLSQIRAVLDVCNGAKELYQFYLNKPFYNRGMLMGKDFQIQYTRDVLNII